MNRRWLVPMAVMALSLSTSAFVTSAGRWPPWLSIETPVNPYDPSAKGAAFFVHATFREGDTQLSDLSGTAEGVVNGARRSIPLRFETTNRANVYALQRQWPTEGRWVIRLALRMTTAIVTLDAAGNVASAQVPTERNRVGDIVPRAVTAREVDSLLTATAKR